jgi:hypothetical protein
MDICTLIIPTVVTSLGCGPGSITCHADIITQRQYCAPGPPSDCNHSSPFYLCERPDKTTYTVLWQLNTTYGGLNVTDGDAQAIGASK